MELFCCYDAEWMHYLRFEDSLHVMHPLGITATKQRLRCTLILPRERRRFRQNDNRNNFHVVINISGPVPSTDPVERASNLLYHFHHSVLLHFKVFCTLFIIYRSWCCCRIRQPRICNSDPRASPNKMQSETADFAPDATSWRTRRNMRVIFDSGPFAPICDTWHYPQNRKYVTYCTSVRWWPSHCDK